MLYNNSRFLGRFMLRFKEQNSRSVRKFLVKLSFKGQFRLFDIFLEHTVFKFLGGHSL